MKRITEMPLQLYISFGSIKRSKTTEDFASGEYLLRNYIREHDCKLCLLIMLICGNQKIRIYIKNI